MKDTPEPKSDGKTKRIKMRRKGREDQEMRHFDPSALAESGLISFSTSAKPNKKLSATCSPDRAEASVNAQPNCFASAAPSSNEICL